MRSIDTANIKPLEIPFSVEESLAGPLIQICFALFQCSARVNARRSPTDFSGNAEDTLGS